MAYPDYQAVLDSTLYQNQPVKKAILSRIAYLTRDNTAPKGWCTAGQQYLADQLGCSVETVQKAVKQFHKDGLLEIQTIRKTNGWRYNRYKLDMEKIKAAARPDREFPQEEATRTEAGEEDNSDPFDEPPVSEPGRPPVLEPTRPPVFNAEATRTLPGHSSYRISSYHGAHNIEACITGETPVPPVRKEEIERGIESEPKREAHTIVCISEKAVGTASLRPAKHIHQFDQVQPRCLEIECGYVCKHTLGQIPEKPNSEYMIAGCTECHMPDYMM